MPVCDDDDEWEYEYDDTETEDLYFTLDLTTHVPDALLKEPPRSKPDRSASHNQEDFTRPDAAEEDDDDDEEAGDDMTGFAGALQVLDLPTRNPLVKFGDRIYSCTWSTDYGTQLYIAETGTVDAPLRPGNVLDIIALSQARLIAKPAVLRPRNDVVMLDPRLSKTNSSHAAGRDHLNQEDDDDSRDPEEENDSEAPQDRGAQPEPSNDPSKPLVIPREKCKDRASEHAASFLERLSAIKHRKGEHDPVPMYSVRFYEGPPEETRAAIREAALRADAERGSGARVQGRITALPDRPIVRRRNFGRKRKGVEVDVEARQTPAGPVPRERLLERLGIREESTRLRPGVLARDGFAVRTGTFNRADEEEPDEDRDEDEDEEMEDA